MAALSWRDGLFLHPSDWRKSLALYAIAGRPMMHRASIAALASLIVTVAIAAVFAAAIAVQLGGQDPPSWVVHQVQQQEKRLEAQEERSRENTRGRSVIEQRLAENDRLHAKLDGLRLEERLATLELYGKIGIALLGLNLAALLPLLFDVFRRRLLGARK